METFEDNSIQNIKLYVDILEKLEKNAHGTMKPDKYSELIDLVLHRMKVELERSKGKKIVVDLANLPAGIKVDEWLKYFEDLGVIFVDNKPKFKAPKQNEYTIPEEYRVNNKYYSYIVPQTKEVPSKYWGMVSQSRTIRWYEE